MNIKIDECNLKNGKNYNNLDLDLYLFVYKEGFASIIYWIDFSNFKLDYDEIIQLSTLTRLNGNEIKTSEIKFIWRNEEFLFSSFYEFCQLIENRILLNCNILKPEKSIPRFTHPLIYLNCIDDCYNTEKIVQTYSHEIQGITNLWEKYEMKMSKPRETELLLKTDFHPFNYGISLASTILSLELHSSNIHNATKFYKMNEKTMHFYERFDWAFQIESSIMEFYILRYFNYKLSKIPNVFTSIWSILKKPSLLIKLVKQLIQISTTYRNIFQSLDEFKNIYLTKRRYTDYASKHYYSLFRLNYLNSIIDKRLSAIQSQINLSYSMLTTLFIFIITIIGLVLTFLQTIDIIKSLS